MKTHYVELDGSTYVAHYFKDSESRITGTVYIGCTGSDNKNEKSFIYSSNKGSDMLLEFDEKEARCMFDFSFVWRGVWESRIYFRDTEYWGEELVEMATVASNLFKHLKTEINTLLTV